MTGITPYLIFDGNCAEAMTFYQHCLGGELETMRMGDSPVDAPPEAADRVIHAYLSDGSRHLMASDNMPGNKHTVGDNVWVFFPCTSDDEVARIHAALGEGGTSVMEPHDSFWGSRFAMLTDRFGVGWMLAHAREEET